MMRGFLLLTFRFLGFAIFVLFPVGHEAPPRGFVRRLDYMGVGAAQGKARLREPASPCGLARFPLKRKRLSDKKSRQIKTLERIPIAKVCQLLRSSR